MATVTVGMLGLVANPCRYPCGCQQWDEWNDQLGKWTRKSFACYCHGT